MSAAATHVRLAAGRIAAGTLRGNDFFAAGIPLGTTAPMLPERAVEKLARESGARVASVPRLILAGRTAAPQAARWLFDLEVPVKSVANGESRSQRRYFVGREVHSWQVTTARNRYEHGDPDDVITLPDGRRFIVKRSAVMSAHLEVVTFEGGAK